MPLSDCSGRLARARILEIDLDGSGTHIESSVCLVVGSLTALPVDPGLSDVKEEAQGKCLELE